MCLYPVNSEPLLEYVSSGILARVNIYQSDPITVAVALLSNEWCCAF